MNDFTTNRHGYVSGKDPSCMIFDEALPTINDYVTFIVEVVSSCHFEPTSLFKELTLPSFLFHLASSSESNPKHPQPQTLNRPVGKKKTKKKKKEPNLTQRR